MISKRFHYWPFTYVTIIFAVNYTHNVWHYNDVIMGAIVSQITSLTIVYSTVYSDADERKHQSSTSMTFVWGIHRWPVNSSHKWPATRKIFPFDDVIMSVVHTKGNSNVSIGQQYEIIPSSYVYMLILFCLEYVRQEIQRLRTLLWFWNVITLYMMFQNNL